jgi:hypothetical protein
VRERERKRVKRVKEHRGKESEMNRVRKKERERAHM